MLLNKGALFEVKHEKSRFIYDTYSKIKQKEQEYPEIMKIFDKVKKQRRKKKSFKNIRDEYKYLCQTLNDNVIDDSIKILAKNLGLTSIKNLSKKELCKKLSERLVIYGQNPEVLENE
jgi:predicted SprT family Zn-dependent metalloprotease